MPTVEKIAIEGFKSIGSAEVDLRPVNVLIGANGSGKSNFIGAFAFLQAIRAAQLQDYVAHAGGADRILHFGSKATESLKFHVYFQNNQYRITLSATDNDRFYPSSESVYFWDRTRYPERPFEEAITHLQRDGEAGIVSDRIPSIGKYVQGQLDGWRIYHFHDTTATSPFKKIGDLHDNRFLRPDGSNLAAFLYFLREKHITQYDLIRRTVQFVAPFFDDFQLEPLALNPDKIRLEWRHKGSDAYFDASASSDGTLRFVALATLFLQPESLRPSVILLDEPELGLHPLAITLLESLVGSASVDTQVILATQSPTLLDHFGPEDVLVADRVKGATQLTRLDPEQLKVWLERYSLGELWEKNELGGRPAGSYHERRPDD